ncbi:MAG: DUF72 domain-containing protein [bacterium]
MRCRGTSLCHIGTSGWSYPHWRSTFYPEDIPQSRWLSHYTQHFDTVEINNSFYHLPSEAAVLSWRDDTPEGFLFAVKGSRYITHQKKLRDVEAPLRNFLERMGKLGEKLGPILFQLPPNWKANAKRLDEFLSLLPMEYEFAVEFRDPSWFDEEVLNSLRGHRVGFCIHDLLDCPVEVTSEIAYIRFHGWGATYGGCYPRTHLERWAERIVKFLAEGIEVYAYFNNDAFGYAVQNAKELEETISSAGTSRRA